MVDRFFFNRINMQGDRVAVYKVFELSAYILVHTAHAYLALFEFAGMTAKETDDSFFFFIFFIILHLKPLSEP